MPPPFLPSSPPMCCIVSTDQHVSEWYIVACPRAANPYDADLQSHPYPHDYPSQMVKLANALLQVASTHQNKTVVKVKIGIHFGAAAGVVLGKHRSFYALYGNTINTAARMAQNADEGKILVSSTFAEKLMYKYVSKSNFQVACTSQGFKHVKGLGHIETFGLVVAGDTTTPSLTRQPTAPLRAPHDEAPVRKRVLSLGSVGPLSDGTQRWLHSSHFQTQRWTGEFVKPFEELFVKTELEKRSQVDMAVVLHMLALLMQWRLVLSVYHTINTHAAALSLGTGYTASSASASASCLRVSHPLFPDSEGGRSEARLDACTKAHDSSAEQLDADVWSRAILIVQLHLVLNVALSALLLMMRSCGYLKSAAMPLLLLKVLALSVVIGVNIALPVVFDAWMAVLLLAFTATHAMTSGLSFRFNLILVGAVLMCGVPFLISRRVESAVRNSQKSARC